jgi:pyrroline-5-carboxylate reductase
MHCLPMPAAEALAPHLSPRHLVISIAAGVRLARLEAALGDGSRVVRVMPNTPCLVQCGASAYALGSAATQRDADLVRELFSSVGLAIEVDEKMVSLWGSRRSGTLVSHAGLGWAYAGAVG